MNKELSNAQFKGVVVTKLDYIAKRLDKLNGSVEKNTDFRKEFTIRYKMTIGFAAFVGGVIVFISNFLIDYIQGKLGGK